MGTIVEDNMVEISQGVGESQRIGKECVIRKIHLRGQWSLPNGTTSNERCRLMFILDTQCNGATATVGNVLETADIDSFLNLENTKRFKILYDRTVTLNAQANVSATNTYPITKNVKWNKMCNIKINWSSTTGAIAELCCNNIFCMAISESGVGVFAGRYRLRFTD